MREADGETELAYYLYAQHGWPPSKFFALPERERAIVTQFAARESKGIKNLMNRQ